MAYAVRNRRSELGLRLALGASPARVEADLVRDIVPVALLGIGLGVASGLLGARAARFLLFGVGPLDAFTIGAALLAMGLATSVATYVPARQVARIDPTEAMRAD